MGRVEQSLGGEHKSEDWDPTSVIPHLLLLDNTMLFPDLRPWAFLLLADSALLWLLQGTLGALLPPGLPGLWLEGTLRLGGLWWLLKVGGLLGLVGTLLAPLCLGTPLFLSLRALVPGALSAPPVRVASAPWSWLLLGYAAVWLGWAMWALLSSPGAQETKQGQENNTDLMWRLLKLSWPDLPYLLAAFFFLIVAVLGESGRGHGNRRWAKALDASMFICSPSCLLQVRQSSLTIRVMSLTS